MSAEEPSTSELTQQMEKLQVTDTTTPETTPTTSTTTADKSTPQQPEKSKQQQPQPQPQQKGKAPANKKAAPPAKKGQPAKATANKKGSKFDIEEFASELDKKDGKINATTGKPIKPTNSLTNLVIGPTHLSRGIGQRPEDYKIPSYIDSDKTIEQTTPPTIPPYKFYAEAMPEGEFQEYTQDFNTYRITSAECKEKDLLCAEQIRDLRIGAEIHRQARQDIQRYLQPGVKLIDIATQLERSVLDMVQANGTPHYTRAFPTGLNLNYVAAHWSPNPGDTTILKQDDTLKVDFGVAINGNIVDCAWTTHFNEKWDPLVKAVREATEMGIRTAGIDVRLCDVGAAIQEVMESYEVEVSPGQMLQVKAIKNLCGHSIGKYQIHAGHSVPVCDNKDQTKMGEGMLYAIETFGTTDPLGKIREDGECSHYMRNFDVPKPMAKQAPAVKLWNVINKKFSTLAFCRRWLEEEGLGPKDYLLPLHQLGTVGSVEPYPPLVVRKPYQTAQFEHTIFLGSAKKEVITRGFDY